VRLVAVKNFNCEIRLISVKICSNVQRYLEEKFFSGKTEVV